MGSDIMGRRSYLILGAEKIGRDPHPNIVMGQILTLKIWPDWLIWVGPTRLKKQVWGALIETGSEQNNLENRNTLLIIILVEVQRPEYYAYNSYRKIVQNIRTHTKIRELGSLPPKCLTLTTAGWSNTVLFPFLYCLSSVIVVNNNCYSSNNNNCCLLESVTAKMIVHMYFFYWTTFILLYWCPFLL